MSRTISVLMRPSRKVKRTTRHSYVHVSQYNPPKYWLNNKVELSHNSKSKKELIEKYNQDTRDAEERYYKAKKRKLRKDAIKIEEMIIIIGSDLIIG